MADLKVSCACILIILIVLSSGAASGEARRLMAELSLGVKVCAGCRSPVKGSAGLTVKMATTDGRPTAPGHSPGIGNKIAGNTRR
ncbi:hypothetical protein ACP70R_006981 [Stipagrostis hirtigluma subsp. patula]